MYESSTRVYERLGKKNSVHHGNRAVGGSCRQGRLRCLWRVWIGVRNRHNLAKRVWPGPSGGDGNQGVCRQHRNDIVFIRQIVMAKSRWRVRERRQRGQATGDWPAFSRTRAGTRQAIRPECQTDARPLPRTELRLHGSVRSPAGADPAGFWRPVRPLRDRLLAR